jgi:hypothetical protein
MLMNDLRGRFNEHAVTDLGRMTCFGFDRDQDRFHFSPGLVGD